VRFSGNARRKLDIALIALFLLGIYLPGAILAAHHHMTADPRELAEVAPPAPEPAARAIARFPRYFRRHFRISFGLRDVLVRANALLKIKGLGVSPSRRILLGKQGWLFYWDEGEPECCTASDPFTSAELAQWVTVLQTRHDWLASRGIKFLFVVAPDKHTIYPDRLPDYVRRHHPESRLDQLLGELREHSSVHALDLRPSMMSSRNRGLLYYRLDTHWDQAGAFVAYQQIISGLSHWFPRARPLGWDSVTVTEKIGPYHDLADLSGLRSGDLIEIAPCVTPKHQRRARVVSGDARALEIENAVMDCLVTESPDAQIPGAVILRDSYGMSLVPFLSEHFGKAVYLWTNNPDPEVVAQQHPAVVIWEINERFLMYTLPKPWLDEQ
jgi:hypothetical protein